MYDLKIDLLLLYHLLKLMTFMGDHYCEWLWRDQTSERFLHDKLWIVVGQTETIVFDDT